MKIIFGMFAPCLGCLGGPSYWSRIANVGRSEFLISDTMLEKMR
ncbi:hypothetical protein [Bradyrhizobium sp. STM 3843]|nr:hypothetical protein [Bradyrhizobium sp. STM 3843]